MLLKTRVLIIVLASLLALSVIGAFGLYSMRQGMMLERRAQITQLLDFADSQLKYFYGLETTGVLSREEAQRRAKEAIAAQKQGPNNYYFIRTLKDDYFVYHPIPSRMGKPDDGGKLPDGRTAVQAYRDAFAKSGTNKGFIELSTPKPGGGDMKPYPKLNGALKFEPWGWMPGIGFYLDDIDNRFWEQSTVFLAVGALLLAIVSFLLFRMRSIILSQLGGEPQTAAECMKQIASGNLNVEITPYKNDNNSLMASLKVMQMKLKNITSAIQENATTLGEQVSKFTEESKSYAETKSDDSLVSMQRTAAKLGKTADILGKSIARFKL